MPVVETFNVLKATYMDLLQLFFPGISCCVSPCFLLFYIFYMNLLFFFGFVDDLEISDAFDKQIAKKPWRNAVEPWIAELCNVSYQTPFAAFCDDVAQAFLAYDHGVNVDQSITIAAYYDDVLLRAAAEAAEAAMALNNVNNDGSGVGTGSVSDGCTCSAGAGASLILASSSSSSSTPKPSTGNLLLFSVDMVASAAAGAAATTTTTETTSAAVAVATAAVEEVVVGTTTTVVEKKSGPKKKRATATPAQSSSVVVQQQQQQQVAATTTETTKSTTKTQKKMKNAISVPMFDAGSSAVVAAESSTLSNKKGRKKKNLLPSTAAGGAEEEKVLVFESTRKEAATVVVFPQDLPYTPDGQNVDFVAFGSLIGLVEEEEGGGRQHEIFQITHSWNVDAAQQEAQKRTCFMVSSVCYRLMLAAAASGSGKDQLLVPSKDYTKGNLIMLFQTTMGSGKTTWIPLRIINNIMTSMEMLRESKLVCSLVDTRIPLVVVVHKTCAISTKMRKLYTDNFGDHGRNSCRILDCAKVTNNTMAEFYKHLEGLFPNTYTSELPSSSRSKNKNNSNSKMGVLLLPHSYVRRPYVAKWDLMGLVKMLHVAKPDFQPRFKVFFS